MHKKRYVDKKNSYMSIKLELMREPFHLRPISSIIERSQFRMNRNTYLKYLNQFILYSRMTKR